MKRTDQLKNLVDDYDQQIKSLCKEGILDAYPRVSQINAPLEGGDIQFVLQHPEWTSKKAITHRADGTWSRPSYWEAGQI